MLPLSKKKKEERNRNTNPVRQQEKLSDCTAPPHRIETKPKKGENVEKS